MIYFELKCKVKIISFSLNGMDDNNNECQLLLKIHK